MPSQKLRGLQAGAALFALVSLGSCKNLDVPNYGNASVDLLDLAATTAFPM